MNKFRWEIDKSFSWEMGHIVWAQELPHQHLSIETNCFCKHVHGHSYEIKVFLGADELDQSSMVTDFKNLNFMKKFVDDVLDHKFMIDINDPNFDIVTAVSSTDELQIVKDYVLQNGNFQNLGQILPSPISRMQLHRNSFVLVDFVPTSENICKYLKQYAQEFIGDIAIVTALELWETKKSHARYSG